MIFGASGGAGTGFIPSRRRRYGTEPRSVSAFGNNPSRGRSTHSPSATSPRFFIPRHAALRSAITETMKKSFRLRYRRECSARGSATYRPSFHYGRQVAGDGSTHSPPFRFAALRRECSAGATATYRPSLRYGRNVAKILFPFSFYDRLFVALHFSKIVGSPLPG